jgi:hypothetical protein
MRAYSQLNAVYQGDAINENSQNDHRACVDPNASNFLRQAATIPLQSRILLTSRLLPRELDGLPGCWLPGLYELNAEDAVDFFHAQGIRGTRAEIEAACEPYGYHALSLRLLSGVIAKDKRSSRDIIVADKYPMLAQLSCTNIK